MVRPAIKDKWFLGNEEDGVNLWSLGLWAEGFLRYFDDYSNLGPFYFIVEFGKGHMRWIVPKRYGAQMARKLLQRVVRRPQWYAKLRQEIKYLAKQLYLFGCESKKIDMGDLSNQQLFKIFEKHAKLVSKIVGAGMCSTLTEVPDGLFVKHLEKIIAKRVTEEGVKGSMANYFSILSSEKEQNIQQLERYNLFKLLRLIQTSRRLKPVFKKGGQNVIRAAKEERNFWKELQKHLIKYSWAYYAYEGPAFTTQKIISELIVMTKEGQDARGELNKLKRKNQAISQKIRRVEKELNLNLRERQLFQALRDTVFMKLCRRDAYTFSFFVLEAAVAEVARRANISIKEARYVAPGEHQRVLLGDLKLKRELAKRAKYCVLFGIKRKWQVLSGKSAFSELKKLYNEKKVVKVEEISGQTGCAGYGQGTVKIINIPEDMKKMRTGDVLVSISTIPSLVPAMRKAAAIVTETGGITCHAAVVSREFNIPCVIGTKIATRVFKDGDMVEVDADRGIIKIV